MRSSGAIGWAIDPCQRRRVRSLSRRLFTPEARSTRRKPELHKRTPRESLRVPLWFLPVAVLRALGVSVVKRVLRARHHDGHRWCLTAAFGLDGNREHFWRSFLHVRHDHRGIALSIGLERTEWHRRRTARRYQPQLIDLLRGQRRQMLCCEDQRADRKSVV